MGGSKVKYIPEYCWVGPPTKEKIINDLKIKVYRKGGWSGTVGEPLALHATDWGSAPRTPGGSPSPTRTGP